MQSTINYTSGSVYRCAKVALSMIHKRVTAARQSGLCRRFLRGTNRSMNPSYRPSRTLTQDPKHEVHDPSTFPVLRLSSSIIGDDGRHHQNGLKSMISTNTALPRSTTAKKWGVRFPMASEPTKDGSFSVSWLCCDVEMMLTSAYNG